MIQISTKYFTAMHQIKQLKYCYNFQKYNDFVFYVHRPNHANGTLISERNGVQKKFGGDIDVANYSFSCEGNILIETAKLESYVLDLDLNFIKFYPAICTISEMAGSIISANVNEVTGLFQSDNLQLILENKSEWYKFEKLTPSHFFLCNNMPEGGLYIYRLEDLNNPVIVDVQKIFDEEWLDEDASFTRLVHYDRERLIIYTNLHFVIIDIDTGIPIYKFKPEGWFRDSIVIGDIIYAASTFSLLKLKFDGNTLQQIYLEQLENLQDNMLNNEIVNLGSIAIPNFVLYDNKIWAVTNSSPKFLLKFDAQTGKREAFWDLRIYPLSNINVLQVIDGDIYISDLENNTVILREAS